MARLNKGFWLWCEFSSVDTEYIIEIQNKVQNELRGPEFKIHLTLAGPFDQITHSSIDGIRTYCSQKSPIEVKLFKYDYQEKFFQSFFIAVLQSKELDGLRNAMFKINNQKPTYPYLPHISLAYGNYKKTVKENLIASLPCLNNSIDIDKVSIVEIGEDINLWKVSERFSFSTAALV
ncbi:2'-5' RNA ligase family protein [Prochlorococcus sp. MIT 1307]|uniref:2'-5' RNA ligase family protein n=1 Tax=Prochlorococcus sp. MIT 1307 TaxID=3096219 RepID=UPI002A747A99|nr:2'-5' RNA ligase family protein [Prochlorococcus sp. MIT 1307]